MTTVFAPPSPVLAEIAGSSALLPVRRLYCVGRNYRDHAREMGMNPDRDPPFFFTKWADTVVRTGSVIPYPPRTDNYHYEVELVVAVGKAGAGIPVEVAHKHIFGYAVGLDMTRRDLQLEARSAGRPWDTGKNFDQSAPLGPIHPAGESGHIDAGLITLAVNGEVQQSADLSELIWSVSEILSTLSEFYPLERGDLIFTGTPAGVGPVVPGDKLVGGIDGLTPVEIEIGERA